MSESANENDGLPTHVPIGVTVDGEGPADGTDELHRFMCWCDVPDCAWQRALDEQWRLALRSGQP